MFTKNHRRMSSTSSDDDPFDVAEKYYGEERKKKLNRVRTFSAFESTKYGAGQYHLYDPLMNHHQ